VRRQRRGAAKAAGSLRRALIGLRASRQPLARAHACPPFPLPQCYVNINRPTFSLVEERLYPLEVAGHDLDARALAEVRRGG
jgi:hypothetical protein